MIYTSEHQVIAEAIYKNEIKWGYDFIPKISSKKKEITDEKGELKQINFYFSNRNEAFRKAKLFIDVVNDLHFQGLIIKHELSDKESNSKFILAEPRKKERNFKEFHEFFDDYLNLEIETHPLEFKTFKEHEYLDQITFWKRRSYKTNFLLAFAIVLFSFLTLLFSIYFNQKILNNTQKIIIDNQNNLLDTLTINNPIIQKELLKIDNTLQNIKSEIKELNRKKK